MIITKDEILNALRMGECFLIYTKLDDSVRCATGTLKTDLIPKEFLPKPDGIKKNSEHLVHYFDINSKGWRCFLVDRLNQLLILKKSEV